MKFLVQGTLYPDVVESGGGTGTATIKSHHNVGGLPDDLTFELVEPLRTLFKDEVRLLGAELGLPQAIVQRHPFPGPGLGIRIIGEVTADRLDVLRAADAIVRDEMTAAGVDAQIWQCPVVLLADVRSVGVQGDGRTYGHPIVLRPVSSEDAMTADWSRLPYDLLAQDLEPDHRRGARGEPRGAGCDEQAAGHHRMGVSPVVRPGGAWLVVALGALSSFGPLCLDMYLPALPQLPGDLSSTASAAQLTLSACIVGLGVGQLITGPASDRFGRRGPLLIGVAVFVAASVVCAVTTSMTLLIVMRLVQGAAGAAGIVVGRAVVADLFAGKVAAAYFSAIAAINGLAPILAPVIGGQVLRVGTWRTVFWVLAGIGVAHVAAGVLRDPRDAAAGAAVVRRDDRRPARVRHAAARSRVHRHGAGRHHGLGGDVRLHLGVAVPAAGRVRIVGAVVQRLLRAERAGHRRGHPGRPDAAAPDHVVRAAELGGRSGAGRGGAAAGRPCSPGGVWRWCWSRCSSWCRRWVWRCRTRRRSRWTGIDGSPARRRRCSVSRSSRSARSPRRWSGSGIAPPGLALAVTAVVAVLIGVVALLVARPMIVTVGTTLPEHLAPS